MAVTEAEIAEFNQGMNLEGNDPNHPIEGADPDALAAEGMGFAGAYMQVNGPITPTHTGKVRTMTKGQLKEQKMNEEAGYPAPLEEAQKVKDMEQKIQSVDEKLNQIMEAIRNPRMSTMAEVPLGRGVGPTGLPAPPSPEPTQPSPPSVDSNESTKPDDEPPKYRSVTLGSGKVVKIPNTAKYPGSGSRSTTTIAPVGLGCVNPSGIVDEPGKVPAELIHSDDWDEAMVVVPEPEPVPMADPKVEATMKLVRDVNDFMRVHDPHQYWRKSIARNIHRNLGFSGWSNALKSEFNERFQSFLSDPQFVSAACRKVLDMEMGYAMGPKIVTTFIVNMAGFTALALSGLDG